MSNSRGLNMNQLIEENFIIDLPNYPYKKILVYHRFVGKGCCKVVVYNKETRKHDYIGCINIVESKEGFTTQSIHTTYNGLPILRDQEFKSDKLGVILDGIEGKNNDGNNGSGTWFSWFISWFVSWLSSLL